MCQVIAKIGLKGFLGHAAGFGGRLAAVENAVEMEMDADRKGTETETEKKHLAEGNLSHSDLEYAMRQINSVLDVSEEDLARIYSIAAQHSKRARLEPWQVRLHHFYSNGRYGEDWAIREVVDESPHADAEKDMVIYKSVAGKGRRRSGVCTRGEFARWARYEVFRDETSWQRKA